MLSPLTLIFLVPSLTTATLPDKSAIMEETDQELSRYLLEIII